MKLWFKKHLGFFIFMILACIAINELVLANYTNTKSLVIITPCESALYFAIIDDDTGIPEMHYFDTRDKKAFSNFEAVKNLFDDDKISTMDLDCPG